MLVTRTNDTVRQSCQTVTLYTMSNWAQPGRRTAVVIDGPTRRVTEPDRRAGLPGAWAVRGSGQSRLPGELRIPVPGLPVPNGRLPAVIRLSPATGRRDGRLPAVIRLSPATGRRLVDDVYKTLRSCRKSCRQICATCKNFG